MLHNSSTASPGEAESNGVGGGGVVCMYAIVHERESSKALLTYALIPASLDSTAELGCCVVQVFTPPPAVLFSNAFLLFVSLVSASALLGAGSVARC